MSQCMHGCPRIRIAFFYRPPKYRLNTCCRILSTLLSFKKPVTWPVCFIILPQQYQQYRREYCLSVFFAFSSLDKNVPLIRMNITIPQLDGFTDPQPSTVGQHQYCPVFKIVDTLKDPFDLLLAQNIGKGQAFLGAPNLIYRTFLTQSDTLIMRFFRGVSFILSSFTT